MGESQDCRPARRWVLKVNFQFFNSYTTRKTTTDVICSLVDPVNDLSFISSRTDAPEEPYDGRSLYDRLKEQKDAKQEEFEESRKFKNMIRGLDDDGESWTISGQTGAHNNLLTDVDHLHEVDVRKVESERKQKEEELKELNDYRKRVSELQEINADQVNCEMWLGISVIIEIFVETRPTCPIKTEAKGPNTDKNIVAKSDFVIRREAKISNRIARTGREATTRERSAAECVEMLGNPARNRRLQIERRQRWKFRTWRRQRQDGLDRTTN